MLAEVHWKFWFAADQILELVAIVSKLNSIFGLLILELDCVWSNDNALVRRLVTSIDCLMRFRPVQRSVRALLLVGVRDALVHDVQLFLERRELDCHLAVIRGWRCFLRNFFRLVYFIPLGIENEGKTVIWPFVGDSALRLASLRILGGLSITRLRNRIVGNHYSANTVVESLPRRYLALSMGPLALQP